MTLIDMQSMQKQLDKAETFIRSGRVTRASGLIIEASLPGVSMGTSCDIEVEGRDTVSAEVVGFSKSTALLMPVGDVQGIGEGARVVPRSFAAEIPVSEALLGRVVDPSMTPIDDGFNIETRTLVPLSRTPPSAMQRRRILEPMVTGVRAIDSMLTVGEGQRMGIFAGAGVGKSSLLGTLARSANADVIVVGLVGERGREVREFVERDLGPEGLARSVVVVATGDAPPLVRVRAAQSATSVAEYFRARGRRVLLLLDSLTRVAMAQREIGLAAGEPPTSKGYPPSVFTTLPQLLERAGNDSGEGSMTAIYTVLVEGDDLSDPIADAARAILDGHIVLSRKLAGSGHFPAIDILQSVSRVMGDVTASAHQQIARVARETLAAYAESADLIEVGAYVSGSNPKVDRALQSIDALNTFLRQMPGEQSSLEDTMIRLRSVFQGGATHAVH